MNLSETSDAELTRLGDEAWSKGERELLAAVKAEKTRRAKQKKPSLVGRLLGGIGSVVAGAVGLGVGKHSGIWFLGALLATAGVWWSLGKFLAAERKQLIPALSFQGALGLMMLMGTLLQPQFQWESLEPIVLLAALLWLAIRPSYFILAALLIYEAAGLVVNAMSFDSAPYETTSSKALLVYVLWRALALMALGAELWRRFRANVQEKNMAPTVQPDEPGTRNGDTSANSAVKPSSQEPEQLWWYAKDGKRMGPLNAQRVAQLIQSGTITLDTLMWRAGMDSWHPLHGIDELQRLIGPLPPLLPE